jgi:hypothetical protein
VNINSLTDIRTWLANHFGWDDRDINLVAEQIRAAEHPAWGDDWTEFFDGLDFDTLRSTRESFAEAAGGTAKAVEAEQRILSAGREFLPPAAIAVLDGAEPGGEYWRWLTSQLDPVPVVSA